MNNNIRVAAALHNNQSTLWIPHWGTAMTWFFILHNQWSSFYDVCWQGMVTFLSQVATFFTMLWSKKWNEWNQEFVEKFHVWQKECYKIPYNKLNSWYKFFPEPRVNIVDSVMKHILHDEISKRARLAPASFHGMPSCRQLLHVDLENVELIGLRLVQMGSFHGTYQARNTFLLFSLVRCCWFLPEVPLCGGCPR